jgi:hypothetical protein
VVRRRPHIDLEPDSRYPNKGAQLHAGSDIFILRLDGGGLYSGRIKEDTIVHRHGLGDDFLEYGRH